MHDVIVLASEQHRQMQEGGAPSEGNDIGKRSADVGQLAGFDESGGQCLLLLGCRLHLTHLLASCGGQAAL